MNNQKFAYCASNGVHSTIVFERTLSAAIKAGALRLNCHQVDIESCSRAKEFDGYVAQGAVPEAILVQSGWCFASDTLQNAQA